MTYAIEIHSLEHTIREYVCSDLDGAEKRAWQLARQYGNDLVSCAVYECNLTDALNACVE